MIEFYGGYQVYSESGVDLTLLRGNLRRTPTERLLKNERGVRLAAAFDAARHARGDRELKAKKPAPPVEAERIIEQLASHKVQFVLIEGLAMRALGSAHITDDLNICYARSRENIAALANALLPLHPCLRNAPSDLPFRLDAATIQAGLNFAFDTDFGEIDILGDVSGLGGYDQVLAKSVEIEIFGKRIHVLGIDGLIAAKKAAGRGKDHGQLLELEEMKKLRDQPPENLS